MEQNKMLIEKRTKEKFYLPNKITLTGILSLLGLMTNSISSEIMKYSPLRIFHPYSSI